MWCTVQVSETKQQNHGEFLKLVFLKGSTNRIAKVFVWKQKRAQHLALHKRRLGEAYARRKLPGLEMFWCHVWLVTPQCGIVPKGRQRAGTVSPSHMEGIKTFFFALFRVPFLPLDRNPHGGWTGPLGCHPMPRREVRISTNHPGAPAPCPPSPLVTKERKSQSWGIGHCCEV